MKCDITSASSESQLGERKVTVLLVDDQPMVGEAVRRMLADQDDIVFHYCQDPTRAIQTAMEIKPTVILQDLVMPEVDGLTLVKFFRGNPKTKDIPLIVLSTKEEPATKAQAFALGSNDYLVKLPDKVELVARIRHHSQGYINYLERNLAVQQLYDELADAAEYVKKIIPPPLTQGPVRTDWRYIPSTSLGGDSLGYHWLDDDNMAIYLLDVCGHGIGSALLSVSVLNVLRSQALPNTDFMQPDEVLTSLNNAFPMEQQNERYFTMWYGVYNRPKGTLVYASGGHPPALLSLAGAGPEEGFSELRTPNMVVGGMPDVDYKKATVQVGEAFTLYIFSDGVYEIALEDGQFWQFSDFTQFMTQSRGQQESELDLLLAKARKLYGSENLEDDFSILKVTVG